MIQHERMLGMVSYMTWIDLPWEFRLVEAIRLWDARFLVLEYLRSEGHPAEREALVEELLKIDGVSLPRIVIGNQLRV